MSQLKLFLLGTPRVSVNEHPVQLNRRKVVALLAYLGVTRQPHRRDALATLFWPESNGASARASLRRELHLLTSTIGDEWLEAERETLALTKDADVWIDSETFQQHLSAWRNHTHRADTHRAGTHRSGQVCDTCLDRLTAAVELYAGDFLAGFTLSDCPEFDEWQFFERESLRQGLAGALEQLVEWHSIRGTCDTGIDYARHWLALDPLHEPAQRTLMRLYAQTGQQAAALRQYETCQRTLEEELGVPPEEETTALYEAIRAKRFPIVDPVPDIRLPRPSELAVEHSATATDGAAAPAITKLPLPVEITPFIGRENEQAQLHNLVGNPHCRLLTIVGLGGIGKTTLALAFAHHVHAEHPDLFPDGIVFVPLAQADADSTTAVPPIYTLADALNLSLNAQEDPLQQILNVLHAKQMLLILDNIEHLIPLSTTQSNRESIVELIEAILQSAEQVQIMATSREPLRLHSEWRLDLEGLEYPDEDALTHGNHVSRQTAAVAEYNAVKLFQQFAQQSQPAFQLSDQNATCISRLCHLLMGNPLALKLAAAWVRLFSCERIVTGITENLDMLATQLRDLPMRQRSMRAIFDYTWARLAPDEQQAFRRLSVFRGGFDESAAEQTAGVTPTLLAGLFDRGLLEVQAHLVGIRYRLHELVAQYAAEKLAADAEEQQQIREQHGDYFRRFCLDLTDALASKNQAKALAAMQVDIENVQSAWERFLNGHNFSALNQMRAALYYYYWSRARGREGQALFARSLAALEEMSDGANSDSFLPLLCAHYNMCANFHYLLCDYAAMRRNCLRTLEIARQTSNQKEEAYALLMMGCAARWQGEQESAQDLITQSLEIHRRLNNRMGEADALHELAQLYVHFGVYENVEAVAIESLTISRELGRNDWIGWALDTLGWLAYRLGHYEDARRYYSESLEQFQSVDHQLGIALALGGLGNVAWADGEEDLDGARRYLEESLSICRRLSHQFYICSRLYGLSQIHNDMGEYDVARRYAEEGLALARTIGNTVFAAYCLCALAEAVGYSGNLGKSRAYVLEAMHLAAKAKLMPPLYVALLHCAQLNIIEIETGKLHGSALTVKQVEAVQWLQTLVEHPAGWAFFRQRAETLLEHVQQQWPTSVFTLSENQAVESLERVAAVILQNADNPTTSPG